MGKETTAVVYAAFAAFERGDMDGILALCDEHILITQPPQLPGADPRQHGHSGVREAFAIWPEQWDDFRVEILDVRETGDAVLVRTRQIGRGKETGIPVDMDFVFAFRVRAGKISEWRIFLSEEEALGALSLK